MLGTLETAGERVLFDAHVGWVADLIAGSAGGSLRRGGREDPTVAIVVERSRAPFASASWEVLGRGVRRQGPDIVVEDAARSGFDLLVRQGTPPVFVYRWRPGAESRLLRASPVRFRLRARAVLMQYPILWRATTLGRAPLHAACFQTAHGIAIVAGAPGAGKSTALAAEQRRGRRIVSDNLCVADPHTVWGLVEPIRTGVRPVRRPGVRVRRTTHGRVESPPPEDRLVAAEPSLIVALQRGNEDAARDAVDGYAARLLVTTTYASGELRRFWPFAAILSMATGLGPPIPGVLQVARALTHRLPCVQVTLAAPGTAISDVLAASARYGDAGRPASVGAVG